ncbi:MAG: multi-sensor hybrid histidine [Desulfobulbaceae bacterium]|nr:MAG: multi-sensor hybrid histidine [Desulfobulbaceae bacterium]
MQPTPLSNNGASSHLDIAVLENLMRQMPDRPEIITRILTSFLHASPGLLADIRTALMAGDPEMVRKAAHAMKSGNLQVGARQLAAMCHELEILGTMGLLLDSELLLAKLEEEYRSVEKEVGLILARSQVDE